jgi:hypothetical protein
MLMQARIARLQSRWSQICITPPQGASASCAEDVSHPGSTSPITLLVEERVGESVGSLIWEGCAALMVHLLTRTYDRTEAAAATDSNSMHPLGGRSVLELGAGVGVLGCMAAKLGAQVCGAVSCDDESKTLMWFATSLHKISVAVPQVLITDRREITHVIQSNIVANQLQKGATVRRTRQQSNCVYRRTKAGLIRILLLTTS